MSLMDRWQPATETAGRKSRLIEYLILRALAYQDMNELDQALLFLTQALETARPEGFIRLFADEGPGLARLLARLLDLGMSPAALDPQNNGYGRSILDIMIQEEPDPAGEAGRLPGLEAGLLDPLKERELQVLRLIAAGLSNREIAGELFLTEGTVKSYTHQIYSKLDVHRRTEAVEKARELGLLP